MGFPFSFKVMGVGIVLGVIGLYLSIEELRYAFKGIETTAQYIESYESTEGALKKRTVRKLAIVFSFTDENGVQQKGGDTADLNWKPPADGVLKIVYVRGSPGTNALVENRTQRGYWLLFGGIAVFVFGGWLMMREPLNSNSSD